MIVVLANSCLHLNHQHLLQGNVYIKSMIRDSYFNTSARGAEGF